MRKKILDPQRLSNRVADACYQYGKEKAFGIFVDTVEHLYCSLLSTNQTVKPSDEVINISAVYINEVRKKPTFKNILGAALVELSPYRNDAYVGSPYIPESLMHLMVQAKSRANGLKSIHDKNCGCGAYILSLMSALNSDFGPEHLTDWSVTGLDDDLLNTKVLSIQVLSNLAIHNAAPGNLSVIHKPFDSPQHEYLMLKLNYNQLSKQYEIMNKNTSWVDSAQAPLFA